MPERPRRPLAALGALTGTVSAAAVASVTSRLSALRRGADPYDTETVVGFDATLLRARVYLPEATPWAAVVMAHGWTMDASFFDVHAEHLRRHGVLTVTYDQRGHGGSALPDPGGYTLSHLGDDVAAVMRTLVDPDLPTVLVGHSMGAMSVIAWAGLHFDAHRHTVLGAVLANTSIHNIVPDAVASLTGFDSDVIHTLLRRVVHSPVPIPPGPWTDGVVRLITCGPAASPEVVALTSRMARGCPPRVRVAFGRELDVLDLREHAARLNAPTTVITADNDLLTPPSHADALARSLPQARIERFGAAGHQAPIEHPGAFVDQILRLLPARHLDRRAG